METPRPIDPLHEVNAADLAQFSETYGHVYTHRRSVVDYDTLQFFPAQQLQEYFVEDYYGTLPYGIFALPNSVISGAQGVFWGPDRRLLIEQNAGFFSYKDLVYGLGATLPTDLCSEETQHQKHLVSLISSCCYCHWHWVMDSLPKVIVAEMSGYTGNYLLPNVRMAPAAAESMQMLGIAPERLVYQTGNILAVEHLYIPTYFSAFSVGEHNVVSNHFMRARMLEVLNEYLVVTGSTSYTKVRLFVPRRHETTSSRRILNQEEMETVLSRYGFQTIYFEDYSFTQQVAISAFCDIMIAPHGSGLVNSLFMPTNSSVIEYFPHKRVDSCGCYERCCVSRGQKYFDEDSIAQVQGDILVDLNRLEAILGSLGK